MFEIATKKREIRERAHYSRADVLILEAQNLNNFRFQTNILSAMRVVCVKCSEDNFQVASFKPEQVVNKEA